jgi:glycosyltransferase involved in cell wall biosynthesis
MTRYLGLKNNIIKVISDHPFENNDFDILVLPKEFEKFSRSELLLNFRVREGVLVPKREQKIAKNIKIAFVGNWKMQCGIASYAENLWPEVAKHIGDFKLFIEKNSSPTGPTNIFGDRVIDTSQIVECWTRGESLLELAKQLKEYNPDIIWIQHEFGLWSNACYWLSFLNQISDYRVIVTMHSVFHHRDKTICEAAMPEITVHLAGAQNVLKNEKKLASRVYVVPHGCFPCINTERLWNFYKTEKTFVQFGFGFKYKGWEQSIRATAVLKQKYSDVFFTGLFSESSHNLIEHQLYYDELMVLVNQLGLQENVSILRGFQSEETLDAYLRTNKVAVFPYVSHPAHEVFGVTGAARLAMSKAIPVITTSVNHFSDIPSIKADTAEEIAEALDKLFSDNQLRDDQVKKQNEYLDENTWSKVALKYIKIFESV